MRKQTAALTLPQQRKKTSNQKKKKIKHQQHNKHKTNQQNQNQQKQQKAHSKPFVLIIQQSLTCCGVKKKKETGTSKSVFGFKFCYYGAETVTEEFCEHLATLGRDERHSTLTLFSSNYSR